MVPLLDSDLSGNVMTGSQSRPAEELFTALRKGSKLRKYGRRGKPKDHYFRLSPDDRELQWESSNGTTRSIPLAVVSRVLQGQVTAVFRRDPLPEFAPVSFSLVYTERGGKERTLDVMCKSTAEFETWFWGIQLVITMVQNLAQGGVARPQPQIATPPRRRSHMQSDDNLAEIKSMAASLQPTKPVMGGGQVLGRVSGVLGFPAKREIGDCYVWGAWGDGEPGEPGCPLQCCLTPTMVHNTHALDVTQVACGSHHAALITRGGEVYTWGSGSEGALGHGTTSQAPAPQRVQRLYGKGASQVACGHTYSGALLADGGLLTWGTGLGGQLALGPGTLAAVSPTRVITGLEGVRLSKLSCGPFHCAAASAEGVLFTWGDGLFGKLGHGSHEGCDRPRPVAALADHWVLSVSCGWWHTAAAGVSRAALPRVSTASVDSSSTISTVTGRDHAAPTGGGALFTWGGDFTWEEPGPKGQGRRDHHKGCLGHGDLLGRLVPTQVSGEDDIKQVACGLNFTVALTTNGQVLQMGSTGNNSTEHNALWEGARVPVLVGGALAPVCAESIACGTSHIAVVASVRPQPNERSRSLNGNSAGAGGAEPGRERMRLLTWGRGGAGQLGLGGDGRGREPKDHNLPQVVTAVEGRRILQIACGGSYTLAVCEHDPREAAARSSREFEPFISEIRANGGSVTPGGAHRGPRGTPGGQLASMAGMGSNLSASSSSLTATSSIRASVPPGGSSQGDNAHILATRRSDRGSRGGALEKGPALHHSRSMERTTAPTVAPSTSARAGAGGGLGSSNTFSASDPNMVSLQQLAQASTKKSRLATSFKGLKRSPSKKGSAEGSGRPLATRSTGQASSYRSMSAPRSEPDLATVSTSSSLTANSMGLATPAASYSLLDQEDGGSSKGSTPGDKYDYGRQLRYWQERAANMEQQLSRKTREAEALHSELQQVTQHTQQPHRQLPPRLGALDMSASSFASLESHRSDAAAFAHGDGSRTHPDSPGTIALAAPARTVSEGGAGSPRMGGALVRGVSLMSWADRSGSRAFTSEGGAGGSSSGAAPAATADATANRSDGGELPADPGSPFAAAAGASRFARLNERQGSLGFQFSRASGAVSSSDGGGGSGSGAAEAAGDVNGAGAASTSADASADASGTAGAAEARQQAKVHFHTGGDSRDGSAPNVASELAAELEALRLRNHALEEQLEQARLEAQERQSSQQVQERLDASRTAGISGRTVPAFAPTRSSSMMAGQGHRRINSVDIGTFVGTSTKEVEPGVFLSLAPREGGGFELKRVRFDKQVFTTEEASEWWGANRERVMLANNIVGSSNASLMRTAPSSSMQQQEQGLSAGGGYYGVDGSAQGSPRQGGGRSMFERVGGDPPNPHSSPAGSVFEVTDLFRPSNLRQSHSPSTSNEPPGPLAISTAAIPSSSAAGEGGASGVSGSPVSAGDASSRPSEAAQPMQGAGSSAELTPTHASRGHKRTNSLFKLFGNGSL